MARRGLLALAIVLLLGHVCVLPTHTHAASPDRAHSHDTAEIHATSCEALRSLGAASPVVPSIQVVMASPIARAESQVTAGSPSPSAKSPPLFLLHASLLI